MKFFNLFSPKSFKQRVDVMKGNMLLDVLDVRLDNAEGVLKNLEDITADILARLVLAEGELEKKLQLLNQRTLAALADVATMTQLISGTNISFEKLKQNVEYYKARLQKEKRKNKLSNKKDATKNSKRKVVKTSSVQSKGDQPKRVGRPKKIN